MTFSEFRQACIKHNMDFGFPEPTGDHIQVALQKYDSNMDGKLSLKEYQNMVIDMLKQIAKLSK